MNGVKMEEDAPIKPDPDTASPGGFVDDDMFEDTGELNIPPDFPASQQVWLTRVPKWLWEKLADFDDDEEIEIGRVYSWKEPGSSEEKVKFQLRLDTADFMRFKDIPKEYKLNTTNPSPNSSYVFSEKDLEGYNPNAYKRPGRPNQPGNNHDRVKDGRVNKYEKRGKKPIPKHTTLAAKDIRDVNCVPIDNKELAQFRLNQNKKTQAGSNKLVIEDLTKLTSAIGGTTAADPSIMIEAKAKPKAQDNKFARIPQNELLDMLLKSFQEYKYWPIKALKDKTRQPEAYLRETLTKVATLVRTGPFANNWMLKPEFEEANYAHFANSAVKEEMAPAPEYDDDDDDGDDEMVDAL
ncbi:transcription initiation factor IIF, beta subunit-domain-containing protein [Phyllosticta capitalensis]|uniref:Transcription initiation factor IIF, beta subunit-domain-containing protein n=1 Tax=Phyllosticta capitalensis TaxID=121624 RepID=A0ABR1YCT9_9PEZI